MNLIILISGKIACGKDHIGQLLYEACQREFPGLTVKKTAFADALKLEAAKKFGLDYERLIHDRDYKQTHRNLLVEFGYEEKKKDPGVWVKKALKDADRTTITIITDFRFRVEFKTMKEPYNVITVRLHASETTRKTRGWTPTASIDHGNSECELDDFNFNFVYKNETPEDAQNIQIDLLKGIYTWIKSNRNGADL